MGGEGIEVRMGATVAFLVKKAQIMAVGFRCDAVGYYEMKR